MHRFLVFESTFELSAWSKSSVQQADLILLVADAADTEDTVGNVCDEIIAILSVLRWLNIPKLLIYYILQIEKALLARCALSRVELVILHQDDTMLPTNTRRFLQPRPTLNAFHHIRKTWCF